MKPIAATIFSESRRDFFWLDSAFGMMASSPVRGLGSNLHFGGIFTSVPAAVATMAPSESFVTRRGKFAGSVADAIGEEIPLEEDVPVPDTRGLVGGVVNTGSMWPWPLTQRLDLFGLGLDYAMYHKRFWGIFDQNDFSPWERLGGIFTSAPTAIGWGGSRIDTFGVGMDHAMYVRTCIGEQWTPDWLRLGGSFTSAASLVSRGPQLDIFARGADFTLRGNHTDGAKWFGWQNLGGALASKPVAVSWGPDRIDIFAIFKDGALWHRWWDGEIWNDWESLGGNYTGEPAVAALALGRIDVFVVDAQAQGLRHQWFSNDTWSLPEPLFDGGTEGVADSATVISPAANRLEVFVPKSNGDIRILKWDGQAWSRQHAGAEFRAPQRYRISVDFVRANKTRALTDDTDAAMISVAAGNRGARIKTQWIGEIGGGVGGPDTAQTTLLEVEPVSVDLAEPMSFSYIVVNNGKAPQDKILAALTSGGNSLSLASSSSMQEDIAKRVVKFISVKIVGAITLSVPVVGSILSIVESWLLDKLSEAVFESCDGVVAVELRAMMGRDLYILTDNGRKTVKVTTPHKGTGSPFVCGDESEYEVTWSIKPL